MNSAFFQIKILTIGFEQCGHGFDLETIYLKYSFYFFQACFGRIFFGEALGLNWLLGTILVVAGALLLMDTHHQKEASGADPTRATQPHKSKEE